jgi:hypothetical protein
MQLLCYALGASALLLLVVVLWRQAGQEREKFQSQFPPISDDEFLARCTPGTSPQVALKVRRIVAENLGVEYGRIYPSSRFVEDLGAD